MKELIQAQRSVKQAMNAGHKTLAFADKLQKANNKTRFKLVGKVVGLVALGLVIRFLYNAYHGSSNFTEKK